MRCDLRCGEPPEHTGGHSLPSGRVSHIVRADRPRTGMPSVAASDSIVTMRCQVNGYCGLTELRLVVSRCPLEAAQVVHCPLRRPGAIRRYGCPKPRTSRRAGTRPAAEDPRLAAVVGVGRRVGADPRCGTAHGGRARAERRTQLPGMPDHAGHLPAGHPAAAQHRLLRDNATHAADAPVPRWRGAGGVAFGVGARRGPDPADRLQRRAGVWCVRGGGDAPAAAEGSHLPAHLHRGHRGDRDPGGQGGRHRDPAPDRRTPARCAHRAGDHDGGSGLLPGQHRAGGRRGLPRLRCAVAAPAVAGQGGGRAGGRDPGARDDDRRDHPAADLADPQRAHPDVAAAAQRAGRAVGTGGGHRFQDRPAERGRVAGAVPA